MSEPANVTDGEKAIIVRLDAIYELLAALFGVKPPSIELRQDIRIDRQPRDDA